MKMGLSIKRTRNKDRPNRIRARPIWVRLVTLPWFSMPCHCSEVHLKTVVFCYIIKQLQSILDDDKHDGEDKGGHSECHNYVSRPLLAVPEVVLRFLNLAETEKHDKATDQQAHWKIEQWFDESLQRLLWGKEEDEEWHEQRHEQIAVEWYISGQSTIGHFDYSWCLRHPRGQLVSHC